jgi:hypothetical protein
MKALALGVALLALAPAAASARDFLAERLLLTKRENGQPVRRISPEEIAAAQKCLDEVRAGAQFPGRVDWQAQKPATAYPTGVADAAERTSACLAGQGLGELTVQPSMSLVTGHLLH